MKKIITSLFTLLILLTSTSKIYSQTGCLTGGTITAPTTYTFDANTQGFSGDFGWVSAGSGELQSTPFSGTVTRTLTTSTLFLPNSATTIGWGFDLGGTANVTSYTVQALYNNGSGVVPVSVCSGGSLTTNGGTLIFAAPAPSQIIGQNFQIRITFTAFGTGSSSNRVLTVDNFQTDAFSSQATLPVTISYFGASAATGGVKLTWMVASELNVNRYEVERSSNGKTFTKIGQVLAANLVTYTYLDGTYSTGSNYYRLKAVDNDGTYKYSAIVLFKVGKNTLSSLRTYPVPATSDVTVFHDAATSTSSISILSTDGRVLKTILPVVGATETQINISSLKSGLYLIRYSILESGTITTKLIKQ